MRQFTYLKNNIDLLYGHNFKVQIFSTYLLFYVLHKIVFIIELIIIKIPN